MESYIQTYWINKEKIHTCSIQRSTEVGENFKNYMKAQCKMYNYPENPRKMNDFLGKYHFLKLTQEEVENSNRLIIIEEIGNAVKKLLKTRNW